MRGVCTIRVCGCRLTESMPKSPFIVSWFCSGTRYIKVVEQQTQRFQTPWHTMHVGATPTLDTRAIDYVGQDVFLMKSAFGDVDALLTQIPVSDWFAHPCS